MEPEKAHTKKNKVNENDLRKYHTTIRLSTKEKQMLQELTERHDYVTTSSMLRSIVRYLLRHKDITFRNKPVTQAQSSHIPTELIVNLRAIGINLNQITRKLNTMDDLSNENKSELLNKEVQETFLKLNSTLVQCLKEIQNANLLYTTNISPEDTNETRRKTGI